MTILLTDDNGQIRAMTDDEKAAYEATVQGVANDIEAAEKEKQKMLEIRKQPLRKLGLSEDEINTVLGL